MTLMLCFYDSDTALEGFGMSSHMTVDAHLTLREVSLSLIYHWRKITLWQSVLNIITKALRNTVMSLIMCLENREKTIVLS